MGFAYTWRPKEKDILLPDGSLWAWGGTTTVWPAPKNALPSLANDNTAGCSRPDGILLGVYEWSRRH